MSKFEDNTYMHTEHCRNCGHPNILHIVKGNTIERHLQNTDCSNCGVVLQLPEYRMGGDRPIL